MVQFLTPAAPADAEITVQRSHFLVHLAPAASEAEARATIAQVRAEHPQARHHCTAFIVGDRAEVARSNDDGEPSGTAGRPILEALQAADLGWVVCVVTRYFGGVLLGTGGLTRAYREAAQAAIGACDLVRMRECVEVQVTASHADAALLQRLARQQGWAALDAAWAQSVTLRFAVIAADAEAALAQMVQATSGRAAPSVVGRRLMA